MWDGERGMTELVMDHALIRIHFGLDSGMIKRERNTVSGFCHLGPGLIRREATCRLHDNRPTKTVRMGNRSSG